MKLGANACHPYAPPRVIRSETNVREAGTGGRVCRSNWGLGRPGGGSGIDTEFTIDAIGNDGRINPGRGPDWCEKVKSRILPAGWLLSR
jgi:hypothetical protein